MVEQKKVSVANFNVVFDDNQTESPMLDYFETVIMPAMKAGYVQKKGDNEFLFTDVHVEKDIDEQYVLVGNIVKKTILEIKSDLDDMGNLVEKDEMHSSAPYSMFVIYLNNHRMILAENQKGSPTIANFRTLTRYVLDRFIRINNDDDSKDKLPIALVNVVGIPRRESIEAILKEVHKVNKLTLRFYPLNGDGDVNLAGAFGMLSKEARVILGAKTGSVSYNSPSNINGILQMVEESNATVEPIFFVTHKDKSKTRIKEDEITETKHITIDGDCAENEVRLIESGKNIKSINYKSEENEEIYNRNKSKIIQFFKK